MVPRKDPRDRLHRGRILAQRMDQPPRRGKVMVPEGAVPCDVADVEIGIENLLVTKPASQCTQIRVTPLAEVPAVAKPEAVLAAVAADPARPRMLWIKRVVGQEQQNQQPPGERDPPARSSSSWPPVLR